MKTILIVIHLLNGTVTGKVDVTEVPEDLCQVMISELYKHAPKSPNSFLAGCLKYSEGTAS